MLSEKECTYFLIMKEYGDKKRSYQEIFNATFNVQKSILKSTVVRTI